MECSLDDDLVARDHENNVAHIEITDWRDGEHPEISAPQTDHEWAAEFRGSLASLTLPDVFVSVSRDNEVIESVTTADTATTVATPVRLLSNGAIRVHVVVHSPDRITIDPAREEIVVTADSRLRVWLGVEQSATSPPTLTVPQTLDGVATALTYAGAQTTDTTPDRSWPSVRSPPPTVEWGEQSIPDELTDARPDTGVEIAVEPELSALLPVAPLAYYLGARVRVDGSTESTTLQTPTREWSLGRTDDHTPGDVLRRVFSLDCVARGAGPHGGGLGVADTFDTLGLDAERLYDASIPDRLGTYLDASFAEVRDRFPEWHLGLSVAPEWRHVPAVVSQLDELPVVREASGTTVSRAEARKRMLSDQHRGGVERATWVDPDEVDARWTGWLGPNLPLRGFKSLPEAYRPTDDTVPDQLSIAVVLNDPEMRAEFESSAAHYGRRADELGIDVDRRVAVAPNGLRQVLVDSYDLVHFIGHCDEDGLVCRNDSRLDLREGELNVRAETFFLNACGSYEQGRALVERGATAGVVTGDLVLNQSAVEVGQQFARLLAVGYSVVVAVRLARLAADGPGRDYRAVGDGTRIITQADSGSPPITFVNLINNTYHVESVFSGPRFAGGEMRDTFEVASERPRLAGVGASYTLTKNELNLLLDTLDAPILVKRDDENEICWPGSRDWI